MSKSNARPRLFNHRPFSLTVESMDDMPILHEVGDIGLTLYLKLTRAQAEELNRRLTENLKTDKQLIGIAFHGIQK